MRTESKHRTRTEEKLHEIGYEFRHFPRKSRSRVAKRRPWFTLKVQARFNSGKELEVFTEV
jgi:hypothetical protein